MIKRWKIYKNWCWQGNGLGCHGKEEAFCKDRFSAYIETEGATVMSFVVSTEKPRGNKYFVCYAEPYSNYVQFKLPEQRKFRSEWMYGWVTRKLEGSSKSKPRYCWFEIEK